jgi:hypothetical protein
MLELLKLIGVLSDVPEGPVGENGLSTCRDAATEHSLTGTFAPNLGEQRIPRIDRRNEPRAHAQYAFGLITAQRA